MTKLLPVLLAFVAVSASAQPLPVKFANIASQIGAPVPASFELAPLPKPSAAGKAVATAQAAAPKIKAASEKAGYVSGSGFLSGSGFAYCSARQNSNETGFFSGSVYVNGDIRVYGADGVSGNAPVSGYVSVTGSCQSGGNGWFNTWLRVQGRVPLYKDGKPAGSAYVDGSQYVTRYVSGGFINLFENVTVSGYSQ